MKVFLCGTKEQIERMQRCIKSDVTVCGATDLTTGGGIPDKNADIYVADDSQSSMLSEQGISSERILRYDWFPQTYFDNPIEGFNESYDAIILGMSHSQCALDAEILSSNRIFHYYKESAPSLDLFLHRKFVDVMSKKNQSALFGIKRIIIELPYYIFNYDLSRFGDFVYTKLNYFETAGDYHHLTEKSEAKKKIEMFKLYSTVFDQAFYTVPPSRKLPSVLIPAKRIYHIYKAIRNNDKVWSHEFPETISENKAIWDNLLLQLHTNCPNAEIVVLVMPFNPAFRISHKKQVERSKRTFYSCIGSQESGEKIRVIDEFDYVKKASLFQDHCHLNEVGGKKYSEHLAELFS